MPRLSSPSTAGHEDLSEDLQEQVSAFVRAFGLHRPDLTPCGEPVTVSQAHALAELAVKGSCPQSELALALRLSKSTVSRLVDQLQESGWVERKRNASGDKRTVELRLTSNGRRVATRIGSARHDRMARLLARIPETERAVVLRSLSVLVEAARD